jgi:peptidoglycan/xylan/chitin deacetylase (PgdA/CDA1 family)
MILILTYHRIVENAGAIREFFDVSAAEFDSHLATVKRAWGASLYPQVLYRQPRVGPRNRSGLLVTFDDGTADHYLSAAPILERHGLSGVFFVSTALLGTSGYLTVSQCRELTARGHAIESHSHDHVHLSSLSEEELCPQLTESRRRLKESGLGQCDLLAPPGGYFNDSVVQAAKNCGYLAVRSLEWGYNRNLDPFRLQCITVNRKTAGKWFGPLISPRFEIAKQFLYRAKETLKQRLPAFYVRLRSSRRAG